MQPDREPQVADRCFVSHDACKTSRKWSKPSRNVAKCRLIGRDFAKNTGKPALSWVRPASTTELRSFRFSGRNRSNFNAFPSRKGSVRYAIKSEAMSEPGDRSEPLMA